MSPRSGARFRVSPAPNNAGSIIDLSEEDIEGDRATTLSPNSRNTLQDALYARQIQNELWSALQPEDSSSASIACINTFRRSISHQTVKDIVLKRDTQILRFNSSDIAAIAGYHEYKHPVDLFEYYLYQDLIDLFYLDCVNLDLAVVSEEEETERIMKKLKSAQPEVHNNLTQRKKDLEKPETLQSGSKVFDLTTDVSKILGKTKDVLNNQEIRLLSDALCGTSKKEYGIRNESSALDLYEKMTGYDVMDRNSSLLVWPLYTTEAVDIVLPPILNKTYYKYSHVRKGLKTCKESSALYPSSEVQSEKSMDGEKPNTQSTISCFEVSHAENEKGVECDVRGIKLNNERDDQVVSDQVEDCGDDSIKFPTFYIIGKVDGISDQVDTRSDDPATWFPIRVVIEIKNRVKRNFLTNTTVKLYEQIQLVTYMLMLGTQYGDLVSVISEEHDASIDKQNNIVKESQENDQIRSLHHPCALQRRSIKRKLDVICDVCKDRGSCTLYCSRCVWNVCESCTLSEGQLQQFTEKSDVSAIDHVQINNSKTQLVLHREYLDSEPHFHRQNWLNLVFPNIVSFYNAIMKIRLNDSMRYEWLQSTEEEKLQMLQTICPSVLNRWRGK